MVRVYAGKPRTRCWRRLDLVPQLSLAEQHARSLSQHRSGGKTQQEPSSHHDKTREPTGQGEPDWVQRIYGYAAGADPSNKGTPVAKTGLA